MKLYVLTLFPEELRQVFIKGIIKKALNRDLFSIEFVNIRDFSPFKYKNVDDYPYGRKQGMLMRADILYNAITSIDNYERYRIIYTCPKGRVFKQQLAKDLAASEGIILIAGYFEGVDERIFDLLNIERLSIGDFVLSSGELPALMFAEAVIRLLPDYTRTDNILEDSIISGLLEQPQYTQPREFLGKEVPEVLLNGHHAHIEKWKFKESLKTTLFNKIDLFSSYQLNEKGKDILVEILKEDI